MKIRKFYSLLISYVEMEYIVGIALFALTTVLLIGVPIVLFAKRKNKIGVSVKKKERIFKDKDTSKFKQILKLMIASVLYAVVACVYFMIVRTRWDTRLGFILPTILETAVFVISLLALCKYYDKTSKGQETVAPAKLRTFVFLGVTVYGVLNMLAGCAFLSQFPHYNPANGFGAFFVFAVYPIQVLVPVWLIYRAFFLFPHENGEQADRVRLIKRCSDWTNYLFLGWLIGIMLLYTIIGAAIPSNHPGKSGAIMLFMTFIGLAGMGALPLIVLSNSLSKGCKNYLVKGEPWVEIGHRFRCAYTMICVCLLFVGNWLALMHFSSRFTVWFYVLHIVNTLPPIAGCLLTFDVCSLLKMRLNCEESTSLDDRQ